MIVDVWKQIADPSVRTGIAIGIAIPRRATRRAQQGSGERRQRELPGKRGFRLDHPECVVPANALVKTPGGNVVLSGAACPPRARSSVLGDSVRRVSVVRDSFGVFLVRMFGERQPAPARTI